MSTDHPDPDTHAPDGSPFELYRRLPYLGELEDIAAALAGHRAVLELGCGTGRLCARLIELGLDVAGVDESAEMLRQLPAGVEGFLGKIESLHLERRWPAVLLPSHLINHPDEHMRRGFVRCARRHLEASGRFYVKACDARWLSTVESGPLGSAGSVVMYAEQVLRQEARVTMTLRYDGFGHTWRHSFTAMPLSETQIESLLTGEGFDDVRWLGARRLWASARLRPPAP